jgi:signal transduction histidine kinase
VLYLTKNKTFIYALLAAVVASGLLLLDIAIPLGVADGILYIALVLIAFFTKNKYFIYISAVTGTLLTITGFFISPPGGELWQVIANRSLTILAIWVIAILCLSQRGHSERMEEVQNNLEKRVQQRTADLNRSKAELERESAYVQLHKDVAIAANETIGLKDTLKVCLEKVCAHANWPVGHVYLLTDQNSKWLKTAKVWFMENPSRFDTFRKISEATPFGPGMGLPGRVLVSKKPEWIIDVTKDTNFPRAKLAENIGVKAGFAFPLLIGKQVVGVMEFFSAEAAEPNRDLMKVMTEVGIQLGRAVERQWAEEDVQNSNERLRKLYQRLEMIREEERTRIAREVHDELAQILSTLKLELSLLDKKMVNDKALLRNDTQMMLALINNTIQTVKRIAMDLRPPILDDLGLDEAILWQGHEFERRTGIHFDFEVCFGNVELDMDRSTAIFRIFQETLTNILRHAKAKNINVRMQEENDMVTVEIEDDGIGITQDQVSDNKSLGLLGMRERARAWDGDVNIRGMQDQGTTVTINIQRN